VVLTRANPKNATPSTGYRAELWKPRSSEIEKASEWTHRAEAKLAADGLIREAKAAGPRTGEHAGKLADGTAVRVHVHDSRRS
jgi:hypothetical protein